MIIFIIDCAFIFLVGGLSVLLVLSIAYGLYACFAYLDNWLATPCELRRKRKKDK